MVVLRVTSDQNESNGHLDFAYMQVSGGLVAVM
jgi:hypothetical protein